MQDADLAQLYDGLARFQWWRRRWKRSDAGEGLEMHKRLLAPRPGEDGPPAGAAGLDEWLWTRLEPNSDVRVLDVGCGFGATLFHWARKPDVGARAQFVGLTLSDYQVQRAEEVAQDLGLTGRCRFRRQSYDEPIEGTFDLIVSIESLFHAPDLRATFANLAGNLAHGGQLVLVEDMPLVAGLENDPSGSLLLERWSTRRFHGAEDYLAAFAAAGLDRLYELDLSAQVPRESVEELVRRRRRLERLGRVAPGRTLRSVMDAFIGGVALQELYSRHQMAYRVMVTRPHAA